MSPTDKPASLRHLLHRLITIRPAPGRNKQAVILIIPVVLLAALLGARLERRRSQRLAGGIVGGVTVLLGGAGLYALIPVFSAVAEVTWPALLLAIGLGAWWGPWVIEGRRSR